MGVNYTISEVLHKLIDESFLPVVGDDQHFHGVLRKSILKAVNALLHDFQADMRWPKENLPIEQLYSQNSYLKIDCIPTI